MGWVGQSIPAQARGLGISTLVANWEGKMSDPLEEFVNHSEPKMRNLARKVREYVRSAYPDLIERLDKGYWVIRYGTGEKMNDDVAYISTHKAHLNIGFMRGSQLPDPTGLLEGTGKMLRHVKIKKETDLQERGEALRALLDAALEDYMKR